MRRIEWGGQAAGYRGWLAVTAAGHGSAVTIHLSTDRVPDAEEIRGSLSKALGNIRDRVADS